MSNDTENFYDQQVEFTYEGKEYIWEGDYTIESIWEEESEYAPAFGDFDVTIDHTTSLSYYDEDLEVNVEVKPTASILIELEFQIERNY